MKDETLEAKKYLLFSMTDRKTGVDNVFRMLNFIFKEARLLGRIPAIGKFTMSPTHNLGNLRDDLCFDDYLDLSNGVTLSLDRGYRQIASHLDWIKEEELDLTNYTPDKMCTLPSNKIVTQKMNQRYDVLIRRNPTFEYILKHESNQYYHDLQIDFPYSQKVNQLTDEVLAVLGTSREYAMAAQRYFFSRINSMQPYNNRKAKILCSDIPLDNGHYACMHVRSSIKDRDYEQFIFPFTSSKEQITSMLEHTVGKGSELYIMSDIHRPKFFDFLKSNYKIYRYYDFPKLQLALNENGKTDNVMLYLVEKSIMKHATIKILPPHKGPMVHHLNTVYRIYPLKNPPHLRKRFETETKEEF